MAVSAAMPTTRFPGGALLLCDVLQVRALCGVRTNFFSLWNLAAGAKCHDLVTLLLQTTKENSKLTGSILQQLVGGGLKKNDTEASE